MRIEYLKSLVSDNIWLEYMFISEGKPHRTNMLGRIELSLSIFLNMVSRVKPHRTIISTLQLSSPDLEGTC